MATCPHDEACLPLSAAVPGVLNEISFMLRDWVVDIVLPCW